MNKYRNQPQVVDGQFFASKAEAKRHAELRLLERAGKIQALRCQPRFPLIVGGKTICTYVGDFYYREHLPADMASDARWGLSALGPIEVVEDVKGCETAVFKLKRKLFEALHRTIELRVISSGKRSSRMRAVPRRVSASKRAASSMPT